MKLIRLSGALLVTALFLYCFGAPFLQMTQGNGSFVSQNTEHIGKGEPPGAATYENAHLVTLHNFKNFQKARMQLPEMPGSLCPVAAGDINRIQDNGDKHPGQKRLHEYRLVQELQFDLDGDGTAENYLLRDGTLTIELDSCIIWQTPHDWWVDYFFFGDADNNGAPELNLIVWKAGRFGPQKPFWIEEDDPGVKNHFFIFKLAEGSIKPVWQSSNLDRPNYRAALVDLSGDGENELVALEGCYNDPVKRKITVWKWNGWGFTRITVP